jgi:small subunit ribosomal protein S20
MEKRDRNRSNLKRLRTALKKVKAALTPEDKIVASREAQSLIDKAGRTRLIHPNKANRLKSRAL